MKSLCTFEDFGKLSKLLTNNGFSTSADLPLFEIKNPNCTNRNDLAYIYVISFKQPRFKRPTGCAVGGGSSPFMILKTKLNYDVA